MSDYERHVAEGLDASYEEACRTNQQEVRLEDLKLVALSDQHRGQGDKADDFKACKQPYHAALGYYLEAGYHLALLGDVEELWECRPKKVIARYKDTLELEKAFFERGRATRVTGNHDDFWEDQGAVDRYLREYLNPSGNGPAVWQGAVFVVSSGHGELGRLFLTHGHQGSLLSDRRGKLGKFLVRYGWRNIQRLTGIRSATPADDFEKKKKHGNAMCDWVSARQGLVLVAGHTHHAVFGAKPHEDVVKEDLAKARAQLEAARNEDDREVLRQKILDLAAHLEWVRAETGGTVEMKAPKPCYFNTGCCSFSDGTVTGLEISDGKIRLVRWPDDKGEIRRKICAEADLRRVFADCSRDVDQPS